MEQQAHPVALVTGSSRGLGKGIALALAEGGYSVAITYVGNHTGAEETLESCRLLAPSREQQFAIFQADIGNPEDRYRLVSQVWETFGTLDALVNNAGMPPRQRADILEASEESFKELLRVNLQGPYFLTQAVAQRWVNGGMASFIPTGYKIVFVTSISAETASVQRGEYCISKAGLAMAVKLWASRLAEWNIQVFEVRPGIMDTDMTQAVKAKYDKLIEQGVVPQKRWGSATDVGKVVRSLLSGDFAFSTGSVIHCDGGFHISRL